MEDNIQEHINKLLTYMTDEAYKPLTVQELEEALKIEDSADFKNFVKALVKMEEKGLVVRTRSNRYGLPQKMNLFRGKLTGTQRGLPLSHLKTTREWMIFSFRQMKRAQRCMGMSSWYGYLRKHRAQGKKARSSEYLNAELHKWSVHTPKVKVLVSSSLMIKRSQTISSFHSMLHMVR